MTKIHSHFIAAFAVVAAILIVGTPNSAQANIGEAQSTVSETIKVIYDRIIQDAATGANFDSVATNAVREELLPKLHIEKFSKLILAAHWKKSTPEQREEFTRILTEFLVRSFVKALVANRDKIDIYLESITISKAVPGNREGRAVVSMLVNFPGSREIQIDFRMTSEDEGAWKLYDVVFEGVSFAINYRSILNSEIKKVGIDEVTANLSEKLSLQK